MKNLIVFVAVFIPSICTFATNMNAVLERLKPAVVKVQVSSSNFFEADSNGSWFGTGFIVNKDLGLVVTNRHVAPAHSSLIEISFWQGSSVSAKLVYYDFDHDFSILKYDPKSSEIFETIDEVELGSVYDLKLRDPVFLVGHSDGQEYSIAQGVVSSLTETDGKRHSLVIRTNMLRAGGSSGSAVVNDEARVVAIHFAGKGPNSFELPIDYLKNVIDDIIEGKEIRRAEVGLKLKYVKVADAIKYQSASDQLMTLWEQDSTDSVKKIGDTPKLIQINQVDPLSESSKVFKPGDILLSVDGLFFLDNLLELDRYLNTKVGENVEVEFMRRGEVLVSSLPVKNAENYKITKYIEFAGSVFHEVTASLRFSLGINQTGVYSPYSLPGAPILNLTGSPAKSPGKTYLVITEIDGIEINSINDMEQALIRMGSKNHFTLSYLDYYYTSSERISNVSIDRNSITRTCEVVRNGLSQDWVCNPIGTSKKLD